MKAYTSDQRRQISARLIAVGRELFSKNGIGRTTVSAMAVNSRISIGEFYRFFPSKEKLWASIFQEELRAIKEMIDEITESQGDPARLLASLFSGIGKLAGTGSFLRAVVCEAYGESGINRKEEFRRSIRDLLLCCTDFLRSWQDRGIIRRGDAEALSVSIMWFAVLPPPRVAIQEGLRDEALETVPDIIASGLVLRRMPGEDRSGRFFSPNVLG